MVDPIRPANDPTKIRIAYPPTQDTPDDAGDSAATATAATAPPEDGDALGTDTAEEDEGKSLWPDLFSAARNLRVSDDNKEQRVGVLKQLLELRF